MEDIKALNQVAEFHRTFKHPILEKASIPSMERCKLRIKLLTEELKELEESVYKQDLVEVADALCDLQYVLAGAILEFGLGDKFKTLFDEVHRSNMSKACKSEQEAIATVKYYKEQANVKAYYKDVDSLYLIYRESDHKTLKSIHYSPADLKSLIYDDKNK